MNKLPLIKPLIKTNEFDDCFITSITDNSKDVLENSLFVARQGEGSHGKEFIKEAIKNGASCVISDQELEEETDIPIHYINNLEDRVTEILFQFHELAADDFIFHGVTGTNGKTTTAFMAHNIMRELQKPSIYIGTLGAIINDDYMQTKGNTTPGIFELFEILKACKNKQKTYVFIEISSHALAQKRLCNLTFFQTIILNIQSDHLDYHKTETNYIDAKLSITNLNNLNPTIISIDQIQDLLPCLSVAQGEQLLKSNFISAMDPSAPFKYSFVYNPEGSSNISINFPSLTYEASISLFLKFNIENYISALALISKHINSNDLKGTSNTSIKLPMGRGEILRLKKGKILIDYAHDYQSMLNILSELHNYYSDIVLIFGCGGDRDKSKRSKMMKVAQDFSNKVFFTSDNNRFESFSKIASDAMNGNAQADVEIIEDRQEAITSALQHLTKENILVILGKGHENFMEISGKKVPFNDRDCVYKILDNEIN